MLKVCQRPELIQQLQHSLEFATDEQVNNDILLKYSLWDYLTPCDADNENILNACIARWRDEANQLYQTTLLQYDPLGNVNLHEDIADERRPDLTDTYSPEDTTTTAEAGYDVPRTMYDAVKTTRGGKDVTTRKGKENYERNKDLTGSDGRYTQQQLVEMQRKLVLDCLSWYVSKFAQCFNVSMSISDYECCEPVPDMCCELVPQVSPVDKKLNDIDNQLGVIQQSLTDCCTSMAEDIDELKKSVADSKTALAAAISDKGVETASNATFAEMVDNITAIPTGSEWELIADWDFTRTTDPNLDKINGFACTTIGTSGYTSNGLVFAGSGSGATVDFRHGKVCAHSGIAYEIELDVSSLSGSGSTVALFSGRTANQYAGFIGRRSVTGNLEITMGETLNSNVYAIDTGLDVIADGSGLWRMEYIGDTPFLGSNIVVYKNGVEMGRTLIAEPKCVPASSNQFPQIGGGFRGYVKAFRVYYKGVE